MATKQRNTLQLLLPNKRRRASSSRNSNDVRAGWDFPFRRSACGSARAAGARKRFFLRPFAALKGRSSTPRTPNRGSWGPPRSCTARKQIGVLGGPALLHPFFTHRPASHKAGASFSFRRRGRLHPRKLKSRFPGTRVCAQRCFMTAQPRAAALHACSRRPPVRSRCANLGF